MFRRSMVLLPAAALTVLAGAANAKTTRHRHAAPDTYAEADQGSQMQGVASWYGASHAGRRMSNGVRFDPRNLTAAHATLPLGSRVKVVREDTGEFVIVTITDRIGTHRRVIDLSQGAAAQIGMLRSGLATVRLVSLGATEEVAWEPQPLDRDDLLEPTSRPQTRHAARSTARTTRASVHTRATTHGSKPIYTASVQQTL